jgi:radical SAM peptide maturase (CXXX-repeat target family)
LYVNPKVQAYLTKYKDIVSLGISLDGNKELHDKCRLDLEGNGSYDRVIAAVHHYKNNFGYMPNIKMTFASENLPYLNESYQYLISEGYKDLHGNCVYEDVWSKKDATELYYQLKGLADYLIENNLYKDIYVSFFNEGYCRPKEEHDNENWCGGVHNSMFAIDNNGLIYHCIRFMDSSLQGEQKALPIGDIEKGFGVVEEHVKNLEMFHSITRRSQSTDECFYCPIAAGCAWCSGYNYQKTGSVNKRVTYICDMHKARSLANVYYWNKIYQKENINKTFIRYLSDEESLKIIPQDEIDLLNSLERG